MTLNNKVLKSQLMSSLAHKHDTNNKNYFINCASFNSVMKKYVWRETKLLINVYMT